MGTQQYASIEDAANLLKCSTRTIRRLIASGELTGYRVGKRLLRVDLADVQAMLRPIPTAGRRPLMTQKGQPWDEAL